MDVVTSCALRAGSIVWRSSAGAWALTVACKATYTLTPGESPLTVHQTPIQDADEYWSDDDRRSLRAASDLVPFKAKADILVTGSAFAPNAKPVSSLVVRVAAAGIDKSIAVLGDRLLLPKGTIHEPAHFIKMPLLWERAAGGPGTSNPVGVKRGSLPNLEPPGRPLLHNDPIEPMCFGPIAPAWPTRMAMLHRHAATWDHARWSERPMPADIDPRYFNAAPLDQQVDEIRGDLTILLEHLHPTQPRLVTKLANVTPRAHIERPNAPPADLVLRCDTLIIDSDLGTCSLVFRGQLWLQHPAEAGRVVVSVEAPRAPPPDPDDGTMTVAWTAPSKQVLPFVPGPSTLVPRSPTPRPARLDDLRTTIESPSWAPTKVLPFERQGSSRAPGDTIPAAVTFGPAPISPAGEEPPPALTPRFLVSPREEQPPPTPRLFSPPKEEPAFIAPPIAPPIAEPPPTPRLFSPPKEGPALIAPPIAEPPPTPRFFSPPKEGPALIAPPIELAPSKEEPPPPLIAPSKEEPPRAPSELEASTAPVAEANDVDPNVVSVDRFAALEATIALGASSRAEVLHDAGLRQRTFTAVERRFKDAFAAESARGSEALRGDYDAAYVATIEEARGPITLSEYAQIMIGLERGRAPAALDTLQIPRAAMMPIVRRWTKKLAGDAKLAGEAQAALRAARRG